MKLLQKLKEIKEYWGIQNNEHLYNTLASLSDCIRTTFPVYTQIISEEKAKNKIYLQLLELNAALIKAYVPQDDKIKLTQLQMQLVPPEMVVELKSIIDPSNVMAIGVLEQLVSGKLKQQEVQQEQQTAQQPE